MPVEAVPIVFERENRVKQTAEAIAKALERGSYIAHIEVPNHVGANNSKYPGYIEGIVLLVETHEEQPPAPDTES